MATPQFDRPKRVKWTRQQIEQARARGLTAQQIAANLDLPDAQVKAYMDAQDYTNREVESK